VTGICQFQATRKLLVAPFELHDRMLSLIQREAVNARKGLPARIIARMNALVDREMKKPSTRPPRPASKLTSSCAASAACGPTHGRQRQHHCAQHRGPVPRAQPDYYFENACQPEFFAGSADWMPRNFYRRIEVVFPIETATCASG